MQRIRYFNPTKEVKHNYTLAKVIILALVCCTASPNFIWSQNEASQGILKAWTDEGFEDIKVTLKADTLFAQIEDHAYRGTFRGAAVALRKVAELKPEITHYELLLTDYQMPQLALHAQHVDSVWTVRVDREMAAIEQQLAGQERQARSNWKIDISVVPMISLVNNKLDHLFDYAVRIAPAIAVTPWKGGRITIQPIVPISYRLTKGDPKHYVQMGSTNISQQFFSNKHWQLSAAAGFFHIQRMGVQARLTYHATRNLDLMLEAGQTGDTYVHKGGVHFGKWKQTDVMAKADYYEPHSKLQFELQGGRFPYGDYGGRLDITRHFAEYAIGVYGVLTGGEHNAGFHFAIPFGGKRQRRTHFLRLRLPEYYAMEYSMSSFFKYTQERMGLTYNTQPDQNHAAHYWEPAFVQEYVSRILNGTFK